MELRVLGGDLARRRKRPEGDSEQGTEEPSGSSLLTRSQV